MQERDGTVKVLSKLAYRLLLPALLFTETAKIAAGQTLLALIPVLVIAALHVMIGAAVGSATARLCGLRVR
jgi:predicted permease